MLSFQYWELELELVSNQCLSLPNCNLSLPNWSVIVLNFSVLISGVVYTHIYVARKGSYTCILSIYRYY